MRLALALSGKRPANDAVALARAAEELGFADVWLTEDYCERGAFALAGAVAVATDRVRVGIGVVNPWTRHSVLTAMETAALAELAPGRVVLGLGASNPRWMEEQLGIPFEQPLTVLDATTRAVRQALGGAKVVGHDGRFDVDVQLAFTPPSPIPLHLGVKGPKALALAGDVADGVLLSVLSSAPYIRWARDILGSGVELGAYVALSIDDDRDAARQHIIPFTATFLGIHGDHAITRTAGLDADLLAAFRRGWVDGAPRTDLVDDRILDTFVVAGDHDTCAARVAELADAGLDALVVHDQMADDPVAQLEAVVEVVSSVTAPA